MRTLADAPCIPNILDVIEEVYEKKTTNTTFCIIVASYTYFTALKNAI